MKSLKITLAAALALLGLGTLAKKPAAKVDLAAQVDQETIARRPSDCIGT